MNSKNSIVKFTANVRLLDHTSTLSKNIKYIIHKYDINAIDMLSTSKYNLRKLCHSKWLEKVDDMYVTYADIIKDMIMMKEDRCLRVFSNEDCNLITKFLCTI